MKGEKEGGSQESRGSWVNLAGTAATKLRSVAPDLTIAKSASAASYGYAIRASEALKGAIKSQSRLPGTPWVQAISAAAADEALKAVLSFVPGGHSIYRLTKAGASEFSKAYIQQPEKKHAAATANEGLAGSSSLETIEKKLEEMSSEVNELKLQNQMLREKMSGISAANQPSLQLSSLSQPPPLLAPEVVPAWQKPEDVIRMFMVKGLKGVDLQSALLFPTVAGRDHGGSEPKP